MTSLGNAARSVVQYAFRYINLLNDLVQLAGNAFGYNIAIDTRNGGHNQNELWIRAGNRSIDLFPAREIIAGNGTMFNPQAILVATWYKVEAYNRGAGPQNAFQQVMPYRTTGETWLI